MVKGMLNEKYEALKKFLVESREATLEELPENVDAVYNDCFKTFEIIGQEYLVLTDEEADKMAEENIKNTLWAFNAEFIWQHCPGYETTTVQEDKAIIESIADTQRKICESANPLFAALIGDMKSFIEDAVETDGRGHFLSVYDGEENEIGEFYIYRTN